MTTPPMRAAQREPDPLQHLRSNLQIVACAGAGKTESVSRRVVAQLDLPGMRPENVVAFTFNERAAAELKDRIAGHYEAAHGTRDRLADLYVGTIHGFCLDLLQTHAPEALSHRVLNDVQQRLLISRYSRKSGLNDLRWHRFHNAGTYAEVMAILREGDIDESALAGTAVDRCLEQYLDLLHTHRLFDFTAIIHEAVLRLEDDARLRARVRDRVKLLTVRRVPRRQPRAGAAHPRASRSRRACDGGGRR